MTLVPRCRACDGFHLKVAGAAADPAHAFAFLHAGTARFDGDLVGDDKAGVKAHAKLADELGVGLLVAAELAHKSLVPLLAMVPRWSMASCALMPMPLSVMVSVLASLSKVTLTLSSESFRTGRRR
jgi:hypothetical protein